MRRLDINQLPTGSYSISGSFSGSFQGDGSQLTGIVSSKWSGSNPITRDGDVEITGSLIVTGGITGSLSGTASYAIQALSASFAPITIGTTAITGGTDGRILFQSGGFVSQSPNLTYNGSLFVLDGNSATANSSIFEVKGAGGQRSFRSYQDNSAQVGGNTNNFQTKGTGTGQVTNNFYSADSHWCFGGAAGYGRVHIGALSNNPQAVLDVRAQGALSTDITFRVRNSANNDNIAEIAGNGLFRFGSTSGYHISLNPTSPSLRGQNGATVAWQLSPWTGEHSWLTNNATNQNLIGIGTTSPTDKLHVYNTINDYRIRVAVGASNPADESCGIRFTTTWAGTSFGADAANLVIRTKGTNNANTQRTALEFRMNTLGTSALRASLTGQSNFLLQSPTEDINDIGVIYIPNGTAPTASIIDGYKQYSADITAGNAAPHFRTENGSIIKLYQQSAVTSSQGLADVLTNVGLLATGSSIATAYERLSDFQSPYHYSGNATLGTSTSSTGWIINRIDFTTPGSPITLQATGSWDNRTSLIYS